MVARPAKRRKLSPPGKESHQNTLGSHSTSHLDETVQGDPLQNGQNSDVYENEEVTVPIQKYSSGSAGDHDGMETPPGGECMDDSDMEKPSNGGTASRKGISKPAQQSAYQPRVSALARDVSRSNVFNLKVEEMLREITPKYGKKEAAAENMLRTLKNIVEAIPDRDPIPVQRAGGQLLKSHKISVPFPAPWPTADAQYKVAFSRPTSINVVGSYAHKSATGIEEKLSIDILVNMPSSLFTEKDYLNHRYFHKRAYYLACIAAGIQDAKDCKLMVSFQNLNGNELQPIILVLPEEKASGIATSNCEIQIIPAMSDNIFPVAKTLPERNCVRPQESKSLVRDQGLLATPFYNASIRCDCLVTSYLKLLHDSTSNCPSFRDACVLGRVWLRQRGLSSSIAHGGYGNFEWSTTMALLLQSGGPKGLPALSVTYNSYQLFRATLQFLASRDFANQPLSIRTQNTVILPNKDSSPMLFDGARSMNILFKMTPCSYRLLQQETQETMRMLKGGSFDHFDSTFIFKVDEPLLRYDLICRIPVKTLSAIDRASPRTDIPESYPTLYETLSKGLGNRATFVNILLSEQKAWSINTARKTSAEEVLTVGLVLDPIHASRAVDRGPSAEDQEKAASFREFWGGKAELRRFKDGQILESVVWTQTSSSAVMEEIILYLLSSMFGEAVAASSRFVVGQVSEIGSEVVKLAQRYNGDFAQLMTAYSTLEKDIRALEGLPLQIRQIQGADPQLSYNSAATTSSTIQTRTTPAGVVIQFEGSGRWPDDLSAIQMTKIAFLLKLDELLQASVPNVTTRLGLENEHSDILNKSYLDIIYPSNLSFRLRIHHEREQTLIYNRLNSTVASSPKAREVLATALSSYKRTFIHSPNLTSSTARFSTRFPALSPTIHLLKSWFDAHLLSRHFRHEVIEIIATRAFVHPQPWQAPSSSLTGFLRTLLFLSRWDWRRDPLIVDFSSNSSGGGMKPAEIASMRTRFEAWRQIDPHLNRVVLFVATDFDGEGVTWTDKGSPSKVVAARMSALAKAACKAVREQGLDLDMGKLFKSPLKNYDFVIRLNATFTREAKPEKSRFKNLQTKQEVLGDIDYDPIALYVSELESLYGEAVTLFHGAGVRNVIAGLWSPHTILPRRWKVSLGYSTSLIMDDRKEADENEEGVEAVINKEGVLAEMTRLGGDMVVGVEVNR